MRFELWLDESGDFKSDHKTHLNPSLVGGVLIEKDVITDEKAKAMIGKDFVHYNEEQGTENLKLLEKLKEQQAEFIIFQNTERVKIIDSDTTYLNILAEGIIQLLLQLSAHYGDFELDITIATRKNTVQGYGIISEKEYEVRLRERIILGLARKALTRKNKWVYIIHFDDARTSQKLMLADGVCNTYLTRTSRKFTKEQKARIDELFNETYHFSFYENIVENDLKLWLAEGRLSDVIFECYMEENLQNREELLDTALTRLSSLDSFGQRMQLLQVSTKVETFVKIDRIYHLIRPVLIKFQSELIPRMKALNIHVPEFNLDMILYLYTLYTHEGSTLAETQDKLFLAELVNVEDMMVKFDYFSKYKLRRAIHQKNMFNIVSSIVDVSKVITVFEDMLEMHELIAEETGGEQGVPTMYDTLGKAYGTRGQAYTMLIYQDKSNLDLAIADFTEALKHFSYHRDQERQYLYTCSAYCEAGDFEAAIENLRFACHLEHATFTEIVKHLRVEQTSQAIFKYHHYYKIMAYAKAAGADEIAEAMYEALLQENVTVEAIATNYEDIHPLQFIMWNMARFLKDRGKQRASLRYFDQAIALCHVELKQITIKVIQLGIYADKALLLENQGKKQEAEQVKQTIREQWQRIKAIPDHETIFENLKWLETENLHELMEFSRRIS